MPSLGAYCQRLKELANQLKDVDQPVTEKRLVLQLVRGSPVEYDVTSSIINNSSPSWEEARDMLEREHQRQAARDALATANTPPLAVIASNPSTGQRTSNNTGPRQPDFRPPNSSRGNWNSNNRGRGNNRWNNNPNRSRNNFGPNNRNNYGPNYAGPSRQPQTNWPNWWGMPPPPCPFSAQPGWAQPSWASNQQIGSGSHGSSSNNNPHSSPHAHFNGFEPTDLGQVFQAMNINQNQDNWVMDTGATSHLTANQGINVEKKNGGLSQASYILDILSRANMTTCRPLASPVDTHSKLSANSGPTIADGSLYRSLAGALQYLTFTRPDISYAVQQVCLFMHDPRESHMAFLKRIPHYLKGTIEFGLHTHPSKSLHLTAYSDAGWGGCPDSRRSTSGYCVYFGDNLISWSSKRQATISRSSAEAEYRGVANTVAETSWIRNLLLELGIPTRSATIIYNIFAVYLSSNPVQHQRTKHVEIDIHFVREKVQIEKLFKDEATEEKGERARMASFVGAMAIADLVKTTLGPKGMDKILQSTGRGHSVTVTNDGATILKSLHIDNPAAKVLIDISKVQDDEVGDGTTSVVVLAGELLREAEKLVGSKIHPMTIISGYRMAADCARKALLDRVKDNKDDAEKFRSDLMKIAMTTLSSKILSQDKEHFAKLAVDAVLRLKGSTNLESIQIIKKAGGSLKDSFLDEGFILDKKIGLGQPKRIENANILVANAAMDTDKVKIYGARVRVDSMAKVAQIEGAEKEKMREKVQKIIGHGINCFVNRQLIYNFPEELFADAGILAIEHADFDGVERLALVTGGEIASTFDNPESVKLGHCKLIEEIMIGEDKLIHFSGVEMGQACTIVLRGASYHVLDEAERSLHDALCVLSQAVNDSRVLLGGGWPEMVMAKAVDELARKTPGKKSHAIEAFSRALIAIPTTIADNAGLDSAELVAQLRAEHHKENSNAGIDVITGFVGDMSELGISEAFKVKQAVLLSATEAAEMILRVNEIITCAPRRREDRM
ncbi:T-complex protein 1 subunit beta-like [Bidens hawaiensis]|uniref:T-complex protein 1 subunit beta-like n=1 Tax=Bidens hawaiensis TaxID=980011 RepID=UPI00404ADA9C